MASPGIPDHMKEDIQSPDFLEEVASLLRLIQWVMGEQNREATWEVRVRREGRKWFIGTTTNLEQPRKMRRWSPDWLVKVCVGKFALMTVELHCMLLNKGRTLPDFILEKTLWKSCLWFLDYRQPFFLLHEDHIASMLASLTALWFLFSLTNDHADFEPFKNPKVNSGTWLWNINSQYARKHLYSVLMLLFPPWYFTMWNMVMVNDSCDFSVFFRCMLSLLHTNSSTALIPTARKHSLGFEGKLCTCYLFRVIVCLT